MFNSNIPPGPSRDKLQNRRTKAEVQALKRFEAKIDRLLTRVDGTIVDYVDTIAASNRKPVPKWLRDDLKRINPGAVEYQRGKRVKRFSGPLMPPYYVQLPSSLRMHQPIPPTYYFLGKHLPDHKPARVDLALDLPTKSQADADLLKDELIVKHLIMLWRSDWEMHEFEDGGTYFHHHGGDDETPQRGRDILVYSNKYCKVTGQPYCTHVDFRFFSADTSRRLLGIHTAEDLINLDRLACIRRYTRLADIRWDHAAKLFEKMVQKHARRFRKQAQQSGRPLSPAFMAAGLRCRLENVIARQLIAGDDDADLPTWDDFKDYPVQKLLEADVGRILRKSVIILPIDRIV